MPMTPRERKAALVLRGIVMSDIARALDVAAAHVSLVVSGDRRSPRVEQAVADAIGLPIEDLFPPPEPKRRRVFAPDGSLRRTVAIPSGHGHPAFPDVSPDDTGP